MSDRLQLALGIPDRLQLALEWTGTGAAVVGGGLLAARVGQPWVAFALMLIGSSALTIAAWRRTEGHLLVLQSAFTILNVIGLWRWFQ